VKRVLSFSYAFVLMNWAAVVGGFYFVSGRKNVWFTKQCRHTLKSDPSPASRSQSIA
jgi:hypothetical protein